MHQWLPSDVFSNLFIEKFSQKSLSDIQGYWKTCDEILWGPAFFQQKRFFFFQQKNLKNLVDKLLSSLWII